MLYSILIAAARVARIKCRTCWTTSLRLAICEASSFVLLPMHASAFRSQLRRSCLRLETSAMCCASSASCSSGDTRAWRTS